MSRRRCIIAATIGASVLLCGGGVSVVGYVAVQTFRGSYRLVSPPSELLERTAHEPQNRPADHPGGAELVGAMSVFSAEVLVGGNAYGTPGQRDYLIFAGTLLNDVAPWGRLDRFLASMRKHGLTTDELAEVPAGPFGGTARCGYSATNGIKAATCLWVDIGTAAIFQAPGLTAEELTADFLAVRHACETDGGRTHPVPKR